MGDTPPTHAGDDTETHDIRGQAEGTPRGFLIGEGSGMPHHVPVHDAIPIVASHAPARSTMPTFLPEDAVAGV